MTDHPGAFLFDLDGTLADTLADIAASCNHVRASHGLQPLPAASVQGMVGDGAETLVRRALLDLQPSRSPDDPGWQQDLAAYRRHHRQQCTVHVRAYPGVREHLDRLAAAGHPLAVVTNKPAAFARAIVAHLGLSDLLPVVIGGDALPQRKPDPAPLRAALAALAAGPAGATMVGDGVQDLRAGKALGLRTIAVLYGYRPEAVLRAEGADLYWRSFGGP